MLSCKNAILNFRMQKYKDSYDVTIPKIYEILSKENMMILPKYDDGEMLF